MVGLPLTKFSKLRLFFLSTKWEVTMLDQTFGGLTLKEILYAISIIVEFAVVAWLFRFLLVKYVKKLTQKTKTNLDDAMLEVLQKPILWIVVSVGFYIATLTLQQESALWSSVTKGFATLLSLLGIYLAVMLIHTLIRWYRQSVIVNKKDVGFSIKLLNLCWIMVALLGLWLGVTASLSIWGLGVDKITGWLGDHGWRIALVAGMSILVIVGMGEIIPRIVTRALGYRPDEKPEEVKKRSDTLSKVLVSTLQVFVFLIAIFMVLSELQIDIAPILASAGVVGIAIGFGAQSLVKDIVAGLFVIIESQYRVGDVVKVADVAGVVESINLRRTVLRDMDGIVHVVPNGQIRVASNFTKEISKVNLNITVGYGENLDHVISVINKVGEEMVKDPVWDTVILKAPQVLRVDNFGDSGIEIKIVGDTQPIRQWDVTGELRLRLKKAFDKENIEIPWPHTKVYFGNALPSPDNCQPVKQKS
jgi:moderate conductance mechanosensitive channel